MEYFLPLSVLAMIISSISIYLLDQQPPNTKSDRKNDQISSDSNDSADESNDKVNVSENQHSFSDRVVVEKSTEEDSLKKIHSVSANLKDFQTPFSMLWNTAPN